MRLKSLHIKGFKSFADETVIHFNESVTGIVGPNGSGKSNIVDAIRWVLGEQKGRELRLEQMSDVIFNGTKKRKEAPLAHVSLHFENTKNLLPIEFQNVEISRYLYRSGDSEYRLNGVSCRLKDITGLFLDTGIGSDSYAIIALNMVEELLSNKESARRKMFEQAAGISKYKTRKRETLNKLKSTKEDLSRIEDLLFEINNNLVELEKQAKRTKKFNDLRERYKAAGLLVQYLSVKTIKEKLSGIEKSIEDENSKVITEEASVNTLEAQIEALKKANLDQEKNLSEFQKKVNDILDVIRSLESIIEIDAQKKIYQTNQLELLEKNIENAASKIESLTMEVERVLADLETTKNELESASRTVIEQEVIYNEKQTAFNQLKSGLDKYQIEKQKIESQIFDCEKEIAINNNQIESLGTDSDRCEQEMGAKSQELINLESQHEQITDRLNSLSGELNNLLTNEEQRLADLKSAQSRVESATEKV
jgi:chromosome segregation protein